MLRASLVIWLYIYELSASVSTIRSLNGTRESSAAVIVTSPCDGQSLEDIMKYKLLCDGSRFVPPTNRQSGFYYYVSGEIVEIPIATYRRYHFEYHVDPESQRSVLSTFQGFDLMVDPFNVPRDILETNGGICIPFGYKEDHEDG